MGDAILPDPPETGLRPFPIAFAHLSFPLCLGVLSHTMECHEGYTDDQATSGGSGQRSRLTDGVTNKL